MQFIRSCGHNAMSPSNCHTDFLQSLEQHSIYAHWSECNNTRTEFNNCPTRCDLFSLLHFCRQLYMFWVLTPIYYYSFDLNSVIPEVFYNN